MKKSDIARISSAALIVTFAAFAGSPPSRAASRPVSVAQAGEPEYTVVNLGSFGGVFGEASSIDDVGIIGGSADPVGDAVTHAAVWSRWGGPFNLGALGGATANSAVAWPNHDNFPLFGFLLPRSDATRVRRFRRAAGWADAGAPDPGRIRRLRRRHE
jgi:hypothetical protein